MRSAVLGVVLLVAACGPATPTLDPEGVARELGTCCCSTLEPSPVHQVLDDSVCASVGGSCGAPETCAAFAAEPCCCITFREDGERRVEASTWGACQTPGTCHPGDCGLHR